MNRYRVTCQQCLTLLPPRRHTGFIVEAPVKPNRVVCAKHNREMNIKEA